MRFPIACAILMASAASPALAQTGGKGITIVLPEQPSNLEPCGSILTDVGQVLNQNITEPLTVINPENGTPQPKLATKWERVDDTTWRFHLRDGVKFQDGKEFNAEAVAFTHQADDRRGLHLQQPREVRQRQADGDAGR